MEILKQNFSNLIMHKDILEICIFLHPMQEIFWWNLGGLPKLHFISTPDAIGPPSTLGEILGA